MAGWGPRGPIVPQSITRVNGEARTQAETS
jgi:hypothetical protein